MALFCHRCGAGLQPGSQFCSSCGTAVAGAPTAPHKPLTRPRMGRQIGGVCIALSQSYGWDVSLVRIFAVIGLFFSCGIVAVAYLAGWIGIPEEPVGTPGAYPPNL